MKKILTSFLTLMLLASASFAEQDLKASPQPQAAIESTQQVEPKNSVEPTLNLKNPGDLKLQTGIAPVICPPVYYVRGYHSMAGVSFYGESLVLEDGSIWEVHPFYSNEVLLWKSTDPLLIFPTNSVYSQYRYIVVNQYLGTQIEVNMTYGPVITNPLSLRVIAIDYLKGEVYLNDNSRWLICGDDSRILNQWIEGDYIVIGTNDNVGYCSLRNILINSNMYDHVFAEQF